MIRCNLSAQRRICYSRLLRALSWVLSICKDRNSTTSLQPVLVFLDILRLGEKKKEKLFV